jgi:uncharacterized membrane protein
MSVQIRPGSKGRSIRQLASDLRTDAGLLVRQEIALAKAEVREKAQEVAKQGALFGAAGMLGYAGLLVLCAALILGVIALGVVAWLATLVVGVVIVAAALLIVRRARHANDSAPQ